MKHLRFSNRAMALAMLAVGFSAERSFATSTVPVNNAGSVLRNVVVVTGANVTRATNFVTNLVATNLGLIARSSNDKTNAAGGVPVTNRILITNLGNITNRFFASPVRYISSNGPGGGGAWAAPTFSTPAGPVARGGVAIITMIVTPSASALNGFERGYVVFISNRGSVAYSGAVRSNYTGDDGLRYGGMLKEHGSGTNGAWITNALNSGATNGTGAFINTGARSNMVYSIRVRAGQVYLTKTIESNKFVTGDGPDGRPLPGSTIFYKILATNLPNGNATGLTIYDIVNTNLVEPVANSLRTNSVGTAARAATYGGVAASDTVGNDQAAFGPTAGTYPANRWVVEFTPRATANFADFTGGNAGGGVLGTAAVDRVFAGWYKVTIR